jgi:dTDP-4-dehydrorhamnose reductase
MAQRRQMEILVLGGTGMLGHKMFQRLRERFPETYCTVRGSIRDAALEHIELFQGGNVCEQVDAADYASLRRLLRDRQPKVIVNCVGIVKQRREAQKALPSIQVNALLPHQLAESCGAWGGRLIHVSTDCVFNGRRGQYRDTDITDAEDLYGRSKALGETVTEKALTLRTSIIGRELFHFQSLLEWFLAQDHKRVRGYQRATYSGTTTSELAAVVGDIIKEHPRLTGLYQVTGPTVSKYELLSVLRDAYALDVEILPDSEFVCDRSMNGEKFCAATGYVNPTWPHLAKELAGDETPYKQWRKLKHEVL